MVAPLHAAPTLSGMAKKTNRSNAGTPTKAQVAAHYASRKLMSPKRKLEGEELHEYLQFKQRGGAHRSGSKARESALAARGTKAGRRQII